MAHKVEIKGNYFYLVIDNSTIYKRSKSKIEIVNSAVSDETYDIIYDGDDINWSEFVDENDTAFGSQSEFDEWVDENTGFNLAGKSSALKTAQYIIGWQDFADTATTLSPIQQTNVNGGEVKLTNNNNDTLTDGNTNVNAETTVKGVNDTWSTVSNTLVFKDTGLEKNDVIDLRVHLNINAKIIDQAFDVRLDFYDDVDGQGNKIFSLRKQIHVETLSAGVFREEMVSHDFFIGESILNGSAEIILEGTKSFDVEVIGWNIKIFKIAR